MVFPSVLALPPPRETPGARGLMGGFLLLALGQLILLLKGQKQLHP